MGNLKIMETIRDTTSFGFRWWKGKHEIQWYMGEWALNFIMSVFDCNCEWSLE